MSAMCPAHLVVGVTNLISGGTVEIMKLVSVSSFSFSHHFLSLRYIYSTQNRDWWVRQLSSRTGTDFSVLQILQTIHMTHPASYSLLTFDCFSEGTMAEA